LRLPGLLGRALGELLKKQKGGLFVNYCSDCMRFFEDSKCDYCGNKKVREISDNDPVYLLTQDSIAASGIEDILRQNGIPCLKRGMLGEGTIAKLGYLFEKYQFFVPYAAYEESKELISNFL
jgi:hypothetical protein